MIEIRNITTSTRAAFNTKWGGAAGRPVVFSLGPRDVVRIGKTNLHQYHDAVKQELAELVASGILELREINSSHLYIDRGNVLDYTNEYFQNVPSDLQLSRGLAGAIELKEKHNIHAVSLTNHNVATVTIDVVDPTNLATLITFFTAANGATARYNAHLADAAAHPNVDTTNVVATVPIDLASCLTALDEIYNAYSLHIEHWRYPGGSVPLSIPAILTY